LERQVGRLQSTLLQLTQRDGQIWLIPDRSATTKEPILVTVGGGGAAMDRFNHPEQRRQLEAAGADSAFRTYLGRAKSLDQYVVFLIRPSGITLFQTLVQSARGMGFEVGYDAIEEDRQIHFSTPPAVDEFPATNAITATPGQKSSEPAVSVAAPVKTASIEPPSKAAGAQPAAATVKPPPAKKSWWQRFLEWLGLA